MSQSSEFMGRDVYSSDEKKLGKVKNVWYGDAYEVEDVLVIGRILGNDIFVPATAVEDSDDGLVVRRPEDFVKSGPALSEDRGPSGPDMKMLLAYYDQAA